MSVADDLKGKEQAFPLAVGGYPIQLGLSQRDWFAGLALQGLLAGRHSIGGAIENFPAWAYRIADAMIAELQKSQEDQNAKA